jgi:hypothetical protein
MKTRTFLEELEQVDKYFYKSIRDMRIVSRDVILSMTNDVMQRDWKLVEDCRWRCCLTHCKLWNVEDKLDEVQKEDKKEEVG